MRGLLLVLLFLSFSGIAQQNYKVLIRFTDKENSEYSISNPQQFLSERAINRRQKQSIEIRQNDIPVNRDEITFNELYRLEKLSLFINQNG